MGFWKELFAPASVVYPVTGQTGIKSPWASTQLSRIVLNDLAGVSAGSVGRADAMKVPAVVRGRGLIAGTLSRYPLALYSYESNEKLDPAPWMISTESNQSPITRMLWTLDDLIFAGISVWATNRDENGNLIDAVRVNPANWSIDPDSMGVIVNGRKVNPDEVIVFEGPQEGLVTIAAEAISASRHMANAWQQRVESPIPLIELHENDSNNELTDDEIDEAIANHEAVRRNGGTVFTPNSITMSTHGDVATDLFIEGRNAERLDWGNFLNLPAAMLDGSMSTATLTYSTTEGKRSEFVDYSLSYWASAVEARLSQDDITPDGTFVRFDISWLTNTTQPGTSPASED